MSTFSPKITHRLAYGYVQSGRPSKSPWEYLKDWDMSDREPDFGNLKITAYMRERWPGKYKVVHRQSPHGRFHYSDLEFESAEAETFFRLQYPK